MSDRINRRDQIAEAAAELFLEHGYAQSSIRQIAAKVGCTEAAIYYHFPAGKRALFEAVIRANTPDFLRILAPCVSAETLPEFIQLLGDSMATHAPRLLPRMQRIKQDFDTLNVEEKSLLHAAILHFHHQMAAQLRRFVSTAPESDALAWILLTAGQGYIGTFYHLDLRQHATLSFHEFYAHLANHLTQQSIPTLGEVQC